MRHIGSEELKKLIYQKSPDKYKKPRIWHKVFVIRKSDNPAFGIVIPKGVVNQFNILDVYYSMKIEGSGTKLIFESGCKTNENSMVVR